MICLAVAKVEYYLGKRVSASVEINIIYVMSVKSRIGKTLFNRKKPWERLGEVVRQLFKD